MDIRMKYTYAVYKERSFTRAAEKLFITQPSLSAMVKKVETELGTAIFDRTASPLELTEAGQAYMEYVEELIRSEETLNEKLWDIQNLNKGSIRIGGSNYVLSSIMPGILRRILSQYPGIRIELVEESSFALRRLIDGGSLDLVIDSFEAADQTLSYYQLFEETILLAVPKNDPANRALASYQITPEMIRHREWTVLPDAEALPLLQKPFVLLKAENDMHQRAMGIFRQYSVQPNALLQLDQLVTSLQYTSAGIGCSFVTDTLFRYGARDADVALYKLRADHDTRDLRIVHRRGKYVSNACRLFIRLAQESFSG